MIRFSLYSLLLVFSSFCFATPGVDISLLDDLQRENLLSAPPHTAFISTPRAAKSLVAPASKKTTDHNKATKPAGKKRPVASRQKNTQLASLKKQNEALKTDILTLRRQLERLKTGSCDKTPANNASDRLFNGGSLPGNNVRKIYTLNALKYDL